MAKVSRILDIFQGLKYADSRNCGNANCRGRTACLRTDSRLK